MTRQQAIETAVRNTEAWRYYHSDGGMELLPAVIIEEIRAEFRRIMGEA